MNKIFLTWILPVLLLYLTPIRILAQEDDNSILASKIEGMLIGSAIGDAAGGPVEFVIPPERSY